MTGGVLVDTSELVNRFRWRIEALVALLTIDLALMHPMIVTALACGTPPAPQSRTLSDIATLPQTRQASLNEVRELIEREQFFWDRVRPGRPVTIGVGGSYTRRQLWTQDKRLLQLAQRFNIAYQPARH